MHLLATLTLAHLLADFPLQTNNVAAMKSKNLQGLSAHVAIYMAATWALLGFDFSALPLVCGLGMAHFAVDWLKITSGTLNPVRMFVFDQCAHLLCLIAGTVIALPWFTTRSGFVLQADLLYPSLAVAVLLAVMVMGWVWACTLKDETLQRYSLLRWGRYRLLEMEQRTGFGLLCVIGVSVMLHR